MIAGAFFLRSSMQQPAAPLTFAQNLFMRFERPVSLAEIAQLIGAEVIGESVGEAIDDVNAAELAASFWVNSQKLYPNKHAIERHGADAWAATNCYNNNGFFQMWQVKNSFGGWDLHGLCQDQDKLVYDIILRRDGKTNRYNFITAFKPKGGFLKAVINYIKLGQKGEQVSPPSDILIYVDDVLVP